MYYLLYFSTHGIGQYFILFLTTVPVHSSWLNTRMSHIQVLSCKVSNNPVSLYNFNFLIK